LPRKELRFVVIYRLPLRGKSAAKANLHLTFCLQHLAKGSNFSSEDSRLLECNVTSTGCASSGLSSLLTT